MVRPCGSWTLPHDHAGTTRVREHLLVARVLRQPVVAQQDVAAQPQAPDHDHRQQEPAQRRIAVSRARGGTPRPRSRRSRDPDGVDDRVLPVARPRRTKPPSPASTAPSEPASTIRNVLRREHPITPLLGHGAARPVRPDCIPGREYRAGAAIAVHAPIAANRGRDPRDRARPTHDRRLMRGRPPVSSPSRAGSPAGPRHRRRPAAPRGSGRRPSGSPRTRGRRRRGRAATRAAPTSPIIATTSVPALLQRALPGERRPQVVLAHRVHVADLQPAAGDQADRRRHGLHVHVRRDVGLDEARRRWRSRCGTSAGPARGRRGRSTSCRISRTPGIRDRRRARPSRSWTPRRTRSVRDEPCSSR